jgi:hypothetical protein
MTMADVEKPPDNESKASSLYWRRQTFKTSVSQFILDAIFTKAFYNLGFD